MQNIQTRHSRIALFAWDGSQTEQQLALRDDLATTLDTIVRAWLTYVTNEGLMPAPVQLEHVSTASSGHTAIISLKSSLFGPNWSSKRKLECIEALLKTIQRANVAIHNVQLLVNHMPMGDDHLDFSSPWPIDGYTQ